MSECERPWKLAVWFILSTVYQSSAAAEVFAECNGELNYISKPWRESTFRGRVRRHVSVSVVLLSHSLTDDCLHWFLRCATKIALFLESDMITTGSVTAVDFHCFIRIVTWSLTELKTLLNWLFTLMLLLCPDYGHPFPHHNSKEEKKREKKSCEM